MRTKFFLVISIMLIAGTVRAAIQIHQSNLPPVAAPSSTQALTREELQQQIQDRSKALDDINKQLEETKGSLKDTQKQKSTLQKDLQTLQGNINQLNLSVKSDQITIQKLSLELESLGLDLGDIKNSITDKQGAIAQLIHELQRKDTLDKNFLMIFLKSDSIVGGVLEAQALSDLQGQLTLDIANLRALREEYNNKIQEASDKRGELSFHKQNLQNRESIIEDQKQQRQVLLVQTKNKESVYQQQISELTKKQQQIANEIETFDAVLRTKIDPSLLPALGPGVLAIPVLGATKNSISQGYGATSFAKNGYRGHWHNGIDIPASIGTPIYAAESGTIVATGNQDAYCYKGAYGKFIVINHEDNLTTLYAHLSRQVVQKGDKVKRGELIGYSGSTGYATGPHLHLTVFAQPTFYMGPSKVCGAMPFGGDLNPLGYL